MKKITLFSISLFFIQMLSAQDISGADLYGTWIFVELHDENGIKQTKIPIPKFGKDAVEKVNRDSYDFKENGEYVSWNPHRTSSGTWFFDTKSRQINLELRISPDDKFLPHLKKAGIVTPSVDGFYYQKPVKKQVLFFSKDSMTIADRDKYYLVYKRE
ncbi:hypothetical protein [Sinomicrobium sp. M5D2P9]